MSKSKYPWTELTATPVHMYVEAIYAMPYQDDEDNTKYRFYLIARKQRSIDPYSHTAGNYITNISGKLKDGSEWNFHSQLISRKTFDAILVASDYDPMEDQFIQLAAEQHRALVNSYDNISFIANVRNDPDNEFGYKKLPTYLIRKSTIEPSPYEFDFKNYEHIWEQRAESTVNKLNALLEQDHGDIVINFIGRPDFPKGQYDEIPQQADTVTNPLSN